MAIKRWEENGETHYCVNAVAKSRSNRALKVHRSESGILSEKDPDSQMTSLARIQTKLSREASRALQEREAHGILWIELVERWEKGLSRESTSIDANGVVRSVRRSTARGYIQSVNDFTTDWMKRPAATITPGDVEDVFKKMRDEGYSNCRIYNAKVAFSACFKWGIKRRLIPGMTISPTHGFGVSRKQSKRPEILNSVQIEQFVTEAYNQDHPWRQIWKGAYHSGARSGELYWLKRKHIDLVERMIYFEEKWNFADKIAEPLKDGEWRQVPINGDLMDLLEELGIHSMGPEDHIFPRLTAWKNNEQARISRAFCEKIEVPSICFHTLRACWATQLLKNRVPEVTVMAMGGWSDPETMHRYIRLAGIEVKGATDSLSFGRRERPGRIRAVHAGPQLVVVNGV